MSAIAGKISKGKVATEKPDVRQRFASALVPTPQRDLVPVVLDRDHEGAGLATRRRTGRYVRTAPEDFLLRVSRSRRIALTRGDQPPVCWLDTSKSRADMPGFSRGHRADPTL